MTRYRIQPAYTPDRRYESLSIETEAPLQPGWFVRLAYEKERYSKKYLTARILQCIVETDGEVTLVVDDRD